MKKGKGKGCLIGCGIFLLGIVLLLIALVILGTILGNASMVEDAVEDIFDDKIYDTTVEDVAKILESEEKTQEFEALILNTLAQSMLGSGQTKGQDLDEIERLSKAVQYMEVAEYRNETIRDAFDARFADYLEKAFEEGDFRHIAKIYDINLKMDFYHTPRDFITNEFFLSTTQAQRDAIFS